MTSRRRLVVVQNLLHLQNSFFTREVSFRPCIQILKRLQEVGRDKKLKKKRVKIYAAINSWINICRRLIPRMPEVAMQRRLILPLVSVMNAARK